MKKLFSTILVLGLLFYINPLNTNNSNADHYKKGIFFPDPYVIGCIYDLLDASFGKKCAHRSLKYYFSENKHRGSMKEAYNKCYSELRITGHRKYRNFNNEDYSIECSD